MSRAALLATILAAFSGIKGNLTEQQWNEGMAIVEGEFDSDLDAVAAYLKAEAAACALVCRVQEKG